MLAKPFILILTSKIILAQMNGEFWWLSDKLPNAKYIEDPKIDNESDFETDESVKIIFRENEYNNEDNKINAITVGAKKKHKNKEWKIDAHFKDDNKIIYPGEYISYDTKHTTPKISNKEIQTQTNNNKTVNEDEFKFYFPDDYLTLKDKDKKYSNKNYTSKNTVHQGNDDKVELIANKMQTPTSENICNYMRKQECYQQKGLVYKQGDRTEKTSQTDVQPICCVLPLVREELSRIVFPGPTLKRRRRSKQNHGPSPTLNQRDVLLKQRYSTSAENTKDTTSKIVSPDEVDEDYNFDPYWNVKNSKFKLSNTNSPTYNDCYQDEDYVVELPKPGLLGVYSDHSRPGWPINDNKNPYGANTYDDYDDDLPGYSTIDPRRDTTTSKFPKRGKPSKLSTVSGENYDPESHTISYQSNPDFQVLQGFKLTNLGKNKNIFYTLNSKKTTTESLVEEDEESIFTGSSSENLHKDYVSSKQMYRHCGKVTGNVAFSNGKQLGSSENGSHPWLALVVLSKRRQVILCYATIVHPRAALTAADCTYGRASGELTLVAGLRDLKDRTNAQYRAVATQIHPRYKNNDLSHNLAILYWSRPLKLTTNVQPACLGEPQPNSECFIFGWGGYDQAIRSTSRWQRTTVLTPRQCRARLSSQSSSQLLPNGAFCAEVQARGTVTGIGGPLVCVVDGRHTATGVAVWRHDILVLLPTHGWPAQALETLLGN